MWKLVLVLVCAGLLGFGAWAYSNRSKRIAWDAQCAIAVQAFQRANQHRVDSVYEFQPRVLEFDHALDALRLQPMPYYGSQDRGNRENKISDLESCGRYMELYQSAMQGVDRSERARDPNGMLASLKQLQELIHELIPCDVYQR